MGDWGSKKRWREKEEEGKRKIEKEGGSLRKREWRERERDRGR